MTHKKTQAIAGIFNMIAAMLIFSTVNFAVKFLSTGYGVWEIVFCRFAFTLIPASVMVAAQRKGFHGLKTEQMPQYIILGALGAGAVFILFKAFAIGQFANVTALAYSSIIFLTLLSPIFLKETVGWRRWLAVAVGFVGIILMVHPDPASFDIGALLAAGFAFFDAILMMMLRSIGKRDKSATIVFFFALYAALFSLPMMLFEGFVMPLNVTDLALLAFLGIGGGIGQLFLAQSYRLAETVVVSPMIYTSLIWGALWGLWFLDEQFSINLIVGALIVVLSSIFIIYREATEYHRGKLTDLVKE